MKNSALLILALVGVASTACSNVHRNTVARTGNTTYVQSGKNVEELAPVAERRTTTAWGQRFSRY